MKGAFLRGGLVLVALSIGPAVRGDDPVLRERARTALRKAVEFYRTKVSTEGGYHFQYTEDLGYGRSEMSEGPTRVEVQRDGTPIVGMAYVDASVITHYSVLVSGAWLAGIEREFQELQGADPVRLKRPDRLHGLSPWNLAGSDGNGRPPAASPEARVRAVIDAMDPRGAWVEDGSIGKANRLVSVFAARDMVVTLGGKALPMKENDTLEVFMGGEPPKGRVIKTRTFVENIGALSAYLGSQ